MSSAALILKIILAFVRRYGKVAPREVAGVFSLPAEEADEWERLEAKGQLKKQKAGNGWFYLTLTNAPRESAG